MRIEALRLTIWCPDVVCESVEGLSNSNGRKGGTAFDRVIIVYQQIERVRLRSKMRDRRSGDVDVETGEHDGGFANV